MWELHTMSGLTPNQKYFDSQVIVRIQATVRATREENTGIKNTASIGRVVGQVRPLSWERSTTALSLHRTSRAPPFDGVDLEFQCQYLKYPAT